MADENPYAGQSDGELVKFSAGGAGAHSVEMMRRLKNSLDAGNDAAAALGDRIWWLNLWLLIFTIAICGLTVGLVLIELGFIRGAR